MIEQNLTSLPRRGFLRKTLGACWAGASLLEQSMLRAAQARAQAASPTSGPLPKLFNIEKVGEGAYAAIAKPQALTNCNAAVFENAADLLIVDTHSKPSAAVSLVSQIRREITEKPVRYIVNTHFHWDHTQGAPAYRRIAPHADILASEVTRRLLGELGEERLKASLEQTQKSLDGYREALARSPAEDKAYYNELIQQSRAYLVEMRNYRPELPDITLSKDLVIHDKAHDLHLAFRGRGHTAGDVVVFCPQAKVIATGDLLHSCAPFLSDGYPIDWNRTLLGVAEFDFEHVIPGHGGVQHTRERLYEFGSFIVEMTEAVVQGQRKGKTIAQIQQETTPSKLVTLQRYGYGDFLSSSLKRYTLHPPSERNIDPLPKAVATCLAQIDSALDRVARETGSASGGARASLRCVGGLERKS